MTYRIMGIHKLVCLIVISAVIASPSLAYSRPEISWGVQKQLASMAFLPNLRGGAEEGEAADPNGSSTVVQEKEEVHTDVKDELNMVADEAEEEIENVETSETATTENESNGGDDDDSNGDDAGKKIDVKSLVFTVTQDGDGSESDPDGIPDRYIRMQKGNREKAKKAFEHTVQWRADHGINDILARPYPTFDLCKRVFPVYIPGRDKENNIVIVQRVGLIAFELGYSYNMTSDDILNYYLYLIEYCWNILEPKPNSVMTTLLDLKGVKISTFRDKHKRQFMKQFVRTMSDNYPNRSHKTIIINAPSWAQMAYKVCKPLLRESTKKKISLWNGGRAQDDILIEVLGKDAVPRELLECPDNDENDDAGDHTAQGSTHEASVIEAELRAFCVSVLEAHGVEMMKMKEEERKS